MGVLRLSLLIFTLLCLTLQTHHLYQLSSLTASDLDKDGLIEVEETSNNQTRNSKIAPNYYIIRVTHKQKKQAYLSMQNMFKKVVRILIKNRIIPDEETLVKSRIKPQYLSKKRSWSFSTIFVIFGNEDELERCYRELSRIRIQRLSTRPSINFLNEKVIALEVFNSAKKAMSDELQRFPDFEIKEVVEIEIKGAHVENSDIIEMQLEEEFNESEEVINEEEIIEGETQTGKSILQMKVIFRVGRSSEASSEDEQYDQFEENDSDEDEDLTDESDNSL